MSITLGDAILYLSADDARLNAGLNRATGKVGGWLRNVAGVAAQGVATVAIGAATAAVAGAAATLGAAFRSGMALDEAFDTLRIRTGAVGEELEGLREDFRAVLREVPQDAQIVASTMSDLHARLGLVGDPLRDTTVQVLTLSRLMGGDAAEATRLYTRMLGDWGIGVEDGGRALDLMFVASQRTGVPVGDLMRMLVQYGAPLRNFGFGLEEGAALLAKWEQEGVNTELVMSGLRQSQARLAREGIPLREGLFATLMAMRETNDESRALALGMELFGARAGSDMTAAVREGRFEIDELVAALADADGAILDTADATDDWQERLQVLRNRVGLALEPLGMRLMDAANALIDRLLPAFDDFAEIFDQRIMPVFDAFMDLLDDLIALRPGDLAAIWQGALQGIWEALVPADIRKGLGQLWEKIAGWAGTAIDFLGRVWEDLAPVLAGVAEFLRPILDAVGEAATGALASAIETLMAWVDGLRQRLEGISKWWGEHGDKVTAVAGGLLAIAGVVVGGGLTLLFGLLESLFALLRGDWQGAVAGVVGGIEGLAEIVLGAMGSSLAQFRADWERTFTLAWELGNVIGERIRGIFLRIKAAIDGVIQSLRDLLPSFRRLDASQLPPWIRPGSPTPFEVGLRGIADASDLLARRSIPTLAGAFAGSAGATTIVNNNAAINNPSFRDGEDLWQAEQTLLRVLRGMA